MAESIYLETTFFSYLAAAPSRDLVVAAHQEITRGWWEGQRGRFSLFVSEAVLAEAERGDAGQARRRLVFLEGIPILKINRQANELAEQLLRGKALPPPAVADALHIALAAVNGIDFLLTWNMKHIANARTSRRTEDACRRLGYRPPVLCTPEELPGGEGGPET